MRHFIAVTFLVLLLAVPWLAGNPDKSGPFFGVISNIEDRLAAVILSHRPKVAADIQARYNSNTGFLGFGGAAHRIRILLVPGHEPGYGGAEYGLLKERELNVELANELRANLEKDNRYDVFVTRGKDSWDPIFQNYFKTAWSDIVEWQKAYKDEIIQLTQLGEFQPVTPAVLHNDAPTDVAFRLYGIGKWANENNIDIIIHIHFNDYPRRDMGSPGKYSGFAIYVPERQYFNSSTTQAVANTVFQRLGKYNPVSNMRGESDGIVQDQDLIATGAYNSVDAASMLIEYGYIYQPEFLNDELRSAAIKDMAFMTYLGLRDFFSSQDLTNSAHYFDSTVLPHLWASSMSDTASKASDVFALQTALIVNGSYPPGAKTLGDCPRTGKFGPCTKEAVSAFQVKNGISGERGVAGTKTIETLNKLFGVWAI